MSRAHRRLGDALPVGRRGGARLLPLARRRARAATARRRWRSSSRTRRPARCRSAASAALVRKTEILWHLLDCVHAATSSRRRRARRDDRARRAAAPGAEGAAAARSCARASTLLLYPERGLELLETRGAHRRGCATGERDASPRSSDELAAAPGEPRERIESEVLSFLGRARANGACWSSSRDRGRVNTPRPYTLVAELTYRCPLRAAYCSNPLELARHADELDTAAWQRVFAEAAALGVLQAQPHRRRAAGAADLDALVAAAHAQQLYVNLITSGIPLDRARLAGLGGGRPRQRAALDPGRRRARRPRGSPGATISKQAGGRALRCGRWACR